MSYLSNKDLLINALMKNGLGGDLNLYLRHYSDKHRKPFVPFIPFSASIEPTNACNFNCRMCNHKDFKETCNLSFENFKKIVNNNPYLLVLHLTGIGEPLLNKDLFEMVKFGNSKRVFSWFFSNMSLFNLENVKKAKESKVGQVGASIDSPNKKTYEYIRTGASFETVISNTRDLVKSGVETFIGTVIMPQNFKELPQMIDLAKDIGIKKICFGSGKSYGKETAYDFFNIDSVELKEIKKQVFDNAKKKDIKIVFFPSDKSEVDKVSYRNCTLAWQSYHVSVKGLVFPCCTSILNLKHEASFGNAITTKIEDIWNNKEYLELRQCLLNNKPGFFCKGCGQVFQKIKTKVKE